MAYEFNPFTGNFDSVKFPAYDYYNIASGKTVTVRADVEYDICDDLTVLGEIVVLGRVCITGAVNSYDRVLNVNSTQWRKGTTAPTETTIGTTPETRVLLFDATNEVAGVYFNFPDDMDLTQDARFDIDWSLVSAETNGDELSVTMDYVVVQENTTGGGLDKTSTQVLATRAVTTANGLAINDVYILQFPIDAGDASNPFTDATGMSLDLHLTNVTEVASMHVFSGHLHYKSKY